MTLQHEGRRAPRDFSFGLPIAVEHNPCFQHHRVFGVPLFPTDAYLEMLYVTAVSRLGLTALTIEGLQLTTPLIARGTDLELRIVLREGPEAWSFAVRSEQRGKVEVHAKGKLRASAKVEPLAASAFQARRTFSTRESYEPGDSFQIGPFYRTIRALHWAEHEARAELDLREIPGLPGDAFLLAPPLVNGVLMTALRHAIECSGDRSSVLVPTSIERIQMVGALAGAPHRARVVRLGGQGEAVTYDAQLEDQDGQAQLVMRGLTVRRVRPHDLGLSGGPDSEAKHEARVARDDDDDAVAIIGYAGRFPGADDIDAFWRNLVAGVQSVTTVPFERWDHERVFDANPRAAGRTVSKWGAFLRGVDQFDAEFFRISPVEAGRMDPQQRLFLQEAQRALESAGQVPSLLAQRTCGVFVGATTSDYEDLLASDHAHVSAQAFTGLSPAVLAGRISYLLDLKGPSLAIDTACSSSLTALNLACQSITSGECDMALAGGVNIMCTPRLHIKASQAGMLSATGACRPFDAGADGIVLGEGVGVVVLKRLREARRDGDHVCAVVRGFAINQDGRTNGITAPNPLAQADLQRRTYRRFAVDPREITYVEAHGTGTRLGDPIEIEALQSSFREHTDERGFCRVGSVKANIGHTTHCAGIASVIKVLLALEHGAIPPTPGVDEINPLIDFAQGPLRFAHAYEPWLPAAGHVRCAAVNSFGFSGTSSFLVLAEPRVQAAQRTLGERAQAIVLSAHSEDALRASVRELRDHLSKHELELEDVAYTLACRRTARRARCGWVVSSRAELLAALDGELAIASAPRAGAAHGGEDASELVATCTRLTSASGSERLVLLSSLLTAYQQGHDVPWERLFAASSARLVRLPAHPYRAQRHWPSTAPQAVIQELTPGLPATQGEAPTRALRFQRVSYRVEEAPTAEPSVGTVLVFSDDDALVAQTAATLDGRLGTNFVQVRTAARFARLAAELYELDPLDDAQHDALWAELAARAPAVSHVAMVCRWRVSAGTQGELQQHKGEGPYRAGRLFRALQKHAPRHTQLLLVHVMDGGLPNPAFGALDALAKTFHSEAPALYCRTVSVERTRSLPAVMTAELRAARGNEAVRHGAAGARELATLQAVQSTAEARLFRRGAAYLVTGGAGGLGRQVAEYLLREYDARLLLVGRRVEPHDVQALRARHGAARVCYLRADVSTQAGVAEALAAAQQNFGAVHGILHLAGEFRAATVARDDESIEAVLRPKVDAAFLLDEATARLPLELFLLFSSISSVLGNPGQAEYAYANGYLDHFAAEREARRARGERHGRTLSVSLPLWRGGRLAIDAGLETLLRTTMDMGVIERDEGMLALERLAGIPYPHIVVTAAPADASVAVEQAPQRERDVIITAQPADVQACLIDEVAGVLGLERDAIHPDDHLMEYGFDSILLTEFANRVNDRFALKLTPASLFRYSCLRELTEHLCKEYGAQLVVRTSGEQVPASPPVSAGATGDQAPTTGGAPHAADPGAIAVIGMAVELAGARDARSYWAELARGGHLLRVPGPARLELAGEALPVAGYLDDVAGFDAEFFGLSPREAKLIDPQQRRFLEIVWRTFEDAGYAPSSLAGSRTGVFVGVATSDYEELLAANHLGGEALAPTGTSHSLVPNRVSYQFDLHGPSEPCNTACSSSLVAVHRACESLRSGACELAIAGGVNMLLTPGLFRAFTAAGMLSPRGRLSAFGQEADGYVRGEGAGAFLLKPLHRAVADGDHIYGVIRGTNVNHGGRAGALTAPNPKAQTALLREVYRRAGIAPDRITYIEAHGSGTPLGDPIEVDALKQLFEELRAEWPDAARDHRCVISTAKRTLGHLEAAAGVAGLAKVLLALEKRQIPGNAGLGEINPQIVLTGSPLLLPSDLVPWPAVRGADGSDLRVAGVSSFGFGGANAHVAIEEYRAPARVGAAGEPLLVLLSARTAAALERYAGALAQALADGTIAEHELADLAFTSQVGREPMSQRLALVIRDREELQGALARVLAKESPAPGTFMGSVARATRTGSTISGDSGARTLEELAAAWVRGEPIDWRRLHGTLRRRLPFVTYPFERVSYWCTDPTFAAPAPLSPTRDLPEEVRDMSKIKLKRLAREQASVVARPAPAVAEESLPALPRESGEHATLLSRLRGLLARTLHVSEAQITDDRAFVELGLDSILAVEFVRQLNASLGTSVRAIDLFDHGTLERLARFMADVPRCAVAHAEPSAPEIPAPVEEPARSVQADAVRVLIREKLAETLHVEPARVVDQLSFREQGLDSILALEFIKRINSALGTTHQAALLFDHPTVDDLASLLAASGRAVAPSQQHESLRAAAAPNGAQHASPQHASERQHGSLHAGAPRRFEDVAVIGMAATLPDAPDVASLWQNLRAGRSGIREVPEERWAASASRARWGGFIEDPSAFDPLFFRISPEEARWMDPQQRLFLETAWSALEDGGYAAERLRAARCGTIVGVMNNDYYELIGDDPERRRSAQVMTGNASAILAARLAYHLDLTGPSLQLDSACSSSLLAVHWACRSLQLGEADLMVAGGVTLYLAESSFAKMSDANMLSASGRCYTFDRRADGFVPGEGAAVLLLKRLQDAERDGDRIYGVIRGSATNQDGKTNGITAPSAASQTELLRRLYEELGILASSIDYVEAHGTATKLGDPIEVQALTDAFRGHTDARGFCGLGSIKSNIGHTAAAAGAAGLIKVLLAFQHEQLPPSINFREPNELIDFAQTPFRVVDRLEPWARRADRVRRAAVSSFGFGGTNVHLVVDEAPARRPEPEPHRAAAEVIVLSARTPEVLRVAAGRLARALAEGGRALADVAYTLQRGRTAFEARFACVADSIEGTIAELESFVRGEPSVMGEHLRMQHPTLAAFADAFQRGESIAWESRGAHGRIVTLPTYAFARERLWIPAVRGAAAEPQHEQRPPTHQDPLELRRAHEPAQPHSQVYEVELNPELDILRDHQVEGRVVCPGALLLALALRAAADAGGPSALADIVFERPLQIEQRVQLRVAVGSELRIEALRAAEVELLLRAQLVRPPATHPVVPARLANPDRTLHGRDLYEAAAQVGITYGPSLRRLGALSVSEREVSAEFEHDGARGQTVSLACALETALQATATFALDDAGRFARAELPFRIGTLRQLAAIPKRGAIRVERPRGGGSCKIVLTDSAAAACLVFEEVVLRPRPQPDPARMLVPVWLHVASRPAAHVERVLIVHERACSAANEVCAALARAYQAQGTRVHTLDSHTATASALREALGPEPTRTLMYWVFPPWSAQAGPAVEDHRRASVHTALRLLQTCAEAELDEQELTLRVLTTQAHAVHAGESIDPSASALTGFMQAASKELRRWSLQCLDLPSPCELDAVARQLAGREVAGDGGALALRNGALHERALEPLELEPATRTGGRLRHGGTYVICGGLGGLGYELAKYLADTYAARLLLVGRRPLTDADRERIAVLCDRGADALYLQADLTDLRSMAEVRRQALQRYRRVDGVVHSALVLEDTLLKNMRQDVLDRVLAPKDVGCAALFEVFRDDALDFMLFFSSVQAFTCNAGQSNYAAASCFEDAYVARSASELRYPCLVIDWGFWGSVGVVADARYRKQLAQLGVRSIEPAEGMAMVEVLLGCASRVPRVLVVKGELRALEGVRVLESQRSALLSVTTDPPTTREVAAWYAETDERARAEWSGLERELEALEQLSQQRLWSELRRMGAFADGRARSVEELQAELAIAPRHQQLFEELLAQLVRAGVLRSDGLLLEVRAAQAPSNEAALDADFAALVARAPALSACVRLLEACASSYAQVLTGKRDARQVLFPAGSTALVDGVYTGHRRRSTIASARACCGARSSVTGSRRRAAPFASWSSGQAPEARRRPYFEHWPSRVPSSSITTPT